MLSLRVWRSSARGAEPRECEAEIGHRRRPAPSHRAECSRFYGSQRIAAGCSMQAVSISPYTFRGMMYQTPSTRYMFVKPNRLKALPLVTVLPSLNWKPTIGTVG